MNPTRTLVLLATAGIITGCAIAPVPSTEDNPYYTTKPLKPYVVKNSESVSSSSSGVVTTPVTKSSAIEVRPLPQTIIVPGKTLPAPPVIAQPASGVDVTNISKLDLNKDGILTAQELLSDGLGKMMAYDRNGDGYLNQAEFQQAMGDRRNRFGASTNLFKHLDLNKDNRLSSQEVAKYLAPSIAALDKDNDGVIRELSPIPAFPSAETPPSPNTIVAGMPRFAKPGAAGSPVKATAARKATSAKKTNKHLAKGKKSTNASQKKVKSTKKTAARKVNSAKKVAPVIKPKAKKANTKKRAPATKKSK